VLIGLTSMLVRSQDPTDSSPTDTPGAPPDPFTSPTPTGPSVPGFTVQCYISEILPSTTEVFPMDENTSNLPALPTGIVCYNVMSDGILGAPFTTIGVPFVVPTDVPGTTGITDFPAASSSTDSTSGTLSSSGSSGSSLKVILPAVLGSVAVASLLVGCLLWARKSRRKARHQEAVGQRAWVQRPGGWVQDRKEEDPQDIALKERRPIGV